MAGEDEFHDDNPPSPPPVTPTQQAPHTLSTIKLLILKKVNDEKQIHATVDSKAVVVTKASIRSSLLLNDVVGTACLNNMKLIFQNLALMG
ncbi:hypothetical protein Tco_0876093 [Tanacetum coccineum]|uniref:Uncharacterized protein n=1 Tax=Tanacetum coccineum TaxID=301880 RepID=A0ABQ5BU32_9ASTR